MPEPDPAARAAATPRPGRPSTVVGVVLLALALLTARLGPALFCAFAAVLAGLAAVELATSMKRQGAAVKPIAAGMGAAAFAVGAYRWGEPALLTMAALLFVAYTGALAVRGLRPGTVRSLTALLLPAVYAGLAGAFLVLIRRGAQGTALAEIFAGMILAYRLGLWVGTRRKGGARGMGPGAPLCVVASPLLGFLLDHYPGMVPMLGLGVVVGLAAEIGMLGSGLLAGSLQPGAKPASRPILDQIEPALLAAPAFFYAFRLLLT